MEIYTTKAHYNVIAFDEVIEPRPEPIILAGETIQPGDKITAIFGKNSSAGFGSFEMIKGFVTYAGKFTVNDDRGESEYVLFAYDFPRDLFGTIHGHQVAYACWAIFENESESVLFYENRFNAGRLIIPRAIRRYVA